MKFQSMLLENIIAKKLGSVDPCKFKNEPFELYSIPAYDVGTPEYVNGSSIGSTKQLVKPGDVLLSKIVPHIRRVWIVGPSKGMRIIASGEWIVFRTNEILPEYLRHILLGDLFHSQYMNTVSGVGGSLLRARPAFVSKIEIPVMDKNEQRRIADILDRADTLRTKRRQTIELMNSLAQSIFFDMFGDLRQNQNNYPIKAFGDLFKTRLGKMLDKKKIKGSHLKPYLRNANVRWFSFDLSEVFEMDFDEREQNILRLCPGDLLICEGGEPGRGAVWEGAIKECYYQKALHCAKPNLAEINPYFVSYQIWCMAQLGMLTDHVTSATIAHLTGEKLKNVPIIVPKIELQNEFEKRLSQLKKITTTLDRSDHELSELVQSLRNEFLER